LKVVLPHFWCKVPITPPTDPLRFPVTVVEP
jgi:hypothetical protein